MMSDNAQMKGFRVVVIGSTQAGKSSLLRRYTQDEFDPEYMETLGIDFRFKQLNINERGVKVQLWDTAGQARFRSITYNYCRGAHAIVVVYDVTDESSFDKVPEWVLDSMLYGCGAITLVANKCDDAVARKISTEQGKHLAERLGLLYCEVSAKTGQGVHQLFDGVIQVVHAEPNCPKITQEAVVAGFEFKATISRYKAAVRFAQDQLAADLEWARLEEWTIEYPYLLKFMPCKEKIQKQLNKKTHVVPEEDQHAMDTQLCACVVC